MSMVRALISVAGKRPSYAFETRLMSAKNSHIWKKDISQIVSQWTKCISQHVNINAQSKHQSAVIAGLH